MRKIATVPAEGASEQTEEVRASYRLHGVVRHSGGSGAGHFVYDLRVPPPVPGGKARWIRHDDTKVNLLDHGDEYLGSEESLRTAYAFAYTHMDEQGCGI